MYSSSQFYNIPVFWLLLVCLLELFIQRTQSDASKDVKSGPNEHEEFPHLLNLVGATNRIHIVSEIVHDGRRIQVEEYLDVASYNQLIQFKWHESNPGQEGKLAGLGTRKSNSLLLNGKEKSVLYHYEPYRCAAIDLTEMDPDAHTKQAKLVNETFPNADHETWASLDMHSNRKSPFLTKLTPTGETKTDSVKWVSGVAGLWLKAQGARGQGRASHSKYVTDGELTYLQDFWRLGLPEGFVVDFYVGKMAKFGRGSGAASFDAPVLIELKNKNHKVRRTINIFNIEFNYSNQLDRNLFTLPIGFNCPANPLSTSSAAGVYFRNQRSQLMEFELVATRFGAPTPTTHETDVKNVELARSKHPMDQSSSLNLFRSIDDRLRIIQDNNNKLEYKIYNLGLTRRCDIEHLQFTEGAAKDGRAGLCRQASVNPISVQFNNRIHLDLSEFNMDFLLGLCESDTKQMRLLNMFDVSDQKSEMVFEADVPSEHSQMVAFASGGGTFGGGDGAASSSRGFKLASGTKFKMRIVRVFEQEVVRSSVNGKFKVRRGLVEFSRAIVFVFNEDTSVKVAELRLNLLENTHLMSFTKRAKLFDLSQCHDLSEESLQLVAHYPAEPELLQTISEQSHEILDSFYLASFDWLGDKSDIPKIGGADAIEGDPRVLQKRRLGASLNFLRVPKIELKLGPTGELEMHLTVIEKNSPLDLFEHLPNCYFLGDDQHDQNLLVSSLRECARHCLHFNCKVFAYETGRQCKLSRLPLLVGQHNAKSPDDTCPAANSRGHQEADGELQPKFSRLAMSPTSDVYFEPPFITGKLIDEASLIEINSYVEHISEELDGYMTRDAGREGEETVGSRDDAFTTRQKRSASPLQQPLFVFEFLDKSGRRSEFESPKRRLLVPSELSVRQVPLTLDIRAIAQATRVDHTFQMKFVKKSYKLTALDAVTTNDNKSIGIATNIRDKDERVFRDSRNKLYYTLKRMESISQENCALLCYNLDEVDRRTSSEQVCVSFSYSRLEEVCILLIKTDFDFVGSILELVKEGDIVHDIQSTNQLLETNFDGVVTARRYLTRFEGPLALSNQFVASLSTDRLLDEKRLAGLELEWLPALVLEGGQVEDHQGEQCAERCSQRNRKGGGMCLAFDYCFTKDLVKAGSLPAETSPGIRRRLTCNLLLIKNDSKEMRSTGRASQVSWLRSYLARATGADRELGGNHQQAEEDSAKVTTCSRYLVSHLREFNHLNKRQLNQDSNELISKKLEKLSETLVDTDQDSCALECAGIRAADCLLFEFCQYVTESKTIEQRCTLFRRTSKRDDSISRSAGLDGLKQLTSYHDGCNVYLRREFETLEQALSDQVADKILAQQQGSYGFQHGMLAICFSLTYAAIVIGFIVFYVAPCRKLSTPVDTTSSAQRPVVSIMMNEINAQQ